jgi:hypothetical protein
MPTKNKFFPKVFAELLIEGTFSSVLKVTKIVEIKVFCLLMEGSGFVEIMTVPDPGGRTPTTLSSALYLFHKLFVGRILLLVKQAGYIRMSMQKYDGLGMPKKFWKISDQSMVFII